MSRRGKPAASSSDAGASTGRAKPRGPGLLAQIGLLVAVFAVVTLIAELAGAANLGVAIAVGQIAFAIVLVALILRAP